MGCLPGRRGDRDLPDHACVAHGRAVRRLVGGRSAERLGRRPAGDRDADWLAAREYGFVEQLKGSMSQERCGDPHAFERSQYVRAIVDYQSHDRANE